MNKELLKKKILEAENAKNITLKLPYSTSSLLQAINNFVRECDDDIRFLNQELEKVA